VDNNRTSRPKSRLTARDRVRRETYARTALFGGAVASVIAGTAIIAGAWGDSVETGQPAAEVQTAGSSAQNIVGDGTDLLGEAENEPARTSIPRRFSENDEDEWDESKDKSDEEWDDEDEYSEESSYPTANPAPSASKSGNSLAIEQSAPHARTRTSPSR
jgi:hypothetical protein